MMPKTKERDFEDAIEHDLLTQGGWTKGDPRDFDRQLALVPKDFFAFVQATQPTLWTELRKHHQMGLEAALLDTLTKSLDSRGALDVLRHGFKFFGKKIECAYFKPAHGMNPEILARYADNRLVLTRQVRFVVDGDESVDLVLFVNGFPVATAELKNPMTHQTVEHAVTQYRERDPRHALFQFKKRALVHFAVDPDLVYMATKLEGKETVFLPFNRGNGTGAGNPEHPSGYRSGYLWEEVWARDSFLDILARFLHLEAKDRTVDGNKVTKETIIFPRYHQLDAVRKLDAAARKDGAGHNYLIQHSAGSGQVQQHRAGWPTAWRAFTTTRTSGSSTPWSSSPTGACSTSSSRTPSTSSSTSRGSSRRSTSTRQQLAEALASGTPIIITTLQKFPFVLGQDRQAPEAAVRGDRRRGPQLADRRGRRDEGDPRWPTSAGGRREGRRERRGRTPRIASSRSWSRAASRRTCRFFAFTATPKHKTLELFGHRDAEGKPSRSTSTRCGRPSRRASSSTCSRTTRPTRPSTGW